MVDAATLKFYADNAVAYAGRERGPPSVQLTEFLTRMPVGATILELGTGGGTDAAHMLAQGMNVTTTDASPELAAEAEQLLGRPVRIMAFDQLDHIGVYHGVWAAAALLHAPEDELTDDLARVWRALLPGGRLMASFKAGNGAGRDSLGRYYNYPSAAVLREHLEAAGTWASLELNTFDGGGYDGLPTRWIWVTAVKP